MKTHAPNDENRNTSCPDGGMGAFKKKSLSEPMTARMRGHVSPDVLAQIAAATDEEADAAMSKLSDELSRAMAELIGTFDTAKDKATTPKAKETAEQRKDDPSRKGC